MKKSLFKTKKGLISTILCVSMVSSLMAGCANNKDTATPDSPSDTNAEESTETKQVETTTSETTGSESQSVQTVEADIPLKEVNVDGDNTDYKALLEAEIYNYKVIRSLEAAYDNEIWSQYFSSGNTLLMLDSENLDEKAQETIMNIYTLRKELKQIKSADECMLYIWNEDMPTEENEDDLVFTNESFDNSDFRPYLTPYLLDDQSQVKGNIIAVSGGEFKSRSNDGEGFPAAHKFNELGYNVFLLQRRVAPYGRNDIYIDFQRSLRYVRYHQDEWGLGRTDVMVGMGWSGGAATLLGEVALYYGDIQPTVIDADYVTDEIDQMSADFDVVIPVYGASYDFSEDYTGLKTDNPNLPAFFISMGADDPIIKIEDTVALFNSVKDKVEAELHVFSQNAHGYGIGTAHTNSEKWPELADQFIQQAVTMRNDDTIEACEGVEYGKIPEKYTKMQSFNGYAGFGTADVTVAVNDEENAYCIFYQAFGQDVMVAGLLYDNGTVNNRFDSTGGTFSASAGYIVQSIDSSAWETIPDDMRP